MCVFLLNEKYLQECSADYKKSIAKSLEKVNPYDMNYLSLINLFFAILFIKFHLFPYIKIPCMHTITL